MTAGLDGTVALVTAAHGPLGAGVGRALAAAGAEVSTVDSLALAGGPAGAARACGEVVDRHGRLDAVVHVTNPPEGAHPMLLADVDDSAWESVWEGTIVPTRWLLRAAHPHLAASGRGRVVLVTPGLPLSGAAGLVAWSTALEGQRLLARSAARQWRDDGVTVNCVTPGPAASGDQAERVGAAVAFLVGAPSGCVTGVVLPADGGDWMES